MLDFFRLMVPVTLMHRGPDRVPYSQSLFVLALLLCTGITLLAAMIAKRPIGLTIVSFVAAATLYGASILFLLVLYGFRNRALQTLTAAFGASAVFGLIDIGIVLVAGMGANVALVDTAALALLLWALVIDGFIISTALGIGLSLGCLLAFSILLPQVALVAAIGGAAS